MESCPLGNACLRVDVKSPPDMFKASSPDPLESDERRLFFELPSLAVEAQFGIGCIFSYLST